MMTTSFPIDPIQSPIFCLQQAAANLSQRLLNLSADPEASLDQIGKLQRAVAGIFATLKKCPGPASPVTPAETPTPRTVPAKQPEPPSPLPVPEPQPESQPQPESAESFPQPTLPDSPSEPQAPEKAAAPKDPPPASPASPNPRHRPTKPKLKPKSKPRTSKYLRRMRKKILHAKTYRSQSPGVPQVKRP